MSTTVRDLDRPGAKNHKKEIVEAVTIVETPPVRFDLSGVNGKDRLLTPCFRWWLLVLLVTSRLPVASARLPQFGLST